MKRKSLLFFLLMAMFAPLAMNGQTQNQLLSENFDSMSSISTSYSSTGWFAYNAGSGNNWTLNTSSSYANSGSNSAQVEYSTSYAANCYLVSKPFTVSSNMGELSVSLYERVRSSSYEETFEVFFVKASDVSNLAGVATATKYNAIASASYTNITYAQQSGSVTNSALAGQSVRVVVHCTSAADKYYLNIDDITVTEIEAEACPKPTGLTATNLTPTSATLNWTGTSDSYNVQYRKAASVELAEGSFFDDFENGLGNWTLIVNAEGTGWQTYDATNFQGGSNYNGNYVAMARSYENGVDITADNWMITSKFTSIPSTMTYWAKNDGRTDHQYDETYDVCVSTSTTSTSDFVIVQTFTTAPNEWGQITIDLSAYAGREGYIAFHHHDAEKDMILIDDVLIGSMNNIPAGEWMEALTPDITNLEDDTDYEWQVQADCGEDGESDWTDIATFHTPSACSVLPTNLTAEVTGNAATLSWVGYTDTYNIQYREVDPTVPATIILNVPTDIWNDGSGYQLVLDADHNTYGTTIPTSGNFTAGTFSDFEYTIPENAECSTTTNTIVVNGNASITIPAGVYDYVFLNPDPNGTTYYIASSNGFSARGDDYEFEAGQTYEFTLSIVGSNDYITATITDNNAWTLVEGVNNPYLLENLSSQTTYEFQVQGADCNNWSASATFTTGEFYVKEIGAYGTHGYYLISSPIATANKPTNPEDVANMIDNTPGADGKYPYDLFRFDQDPEDGSGKEWRNYRATNDGFDLEFGKGYLYANSNDVNLVFTGTAYNGNGKVTLTKTDDASADFPGWNLVGNPFATKIVEIKDGGNNTLSFYKMTGDGRQIIAATNTTVQPMEGVFVIAEADGEEITFTPITEGSKGSLTALNLSDGNEFVDRAIVRFGQGRQLPKLQLDRNSSKLYIPQDGQDYAVVYSEEMGALPVNFKAENNGTYCLNLSSENVEFAYLHLIDNKTGNDIDLLQTPSYSFEAKTTDYESRFKLVFATGDNSNDNNFAFFSNGSFVINNDGAAELQVIDLMGRILSSETINGCTNVNVNAAPGVYMLRLINGDNVKVQKVVVK